MEENKTISQEELEQLMRDAEQGDAEAQCSLGQCYARGWGVETNLDVAFYWCAKAAERGKATAQFNLGQYYYMYMQDYKQAAKWFTLAAEQGHMYARHNLATLYYHGQGGKAKL